MDDSGNLAMRRVGQLTGHIVSGSCPPVTVAGKVQVGAASTEGLAGEPNSGYVTVEGALGDAMLANYIKTGFHVCTLDELRPSFHREFGERMRVMWEAGNQEEQDWLSLEPALIKVLRAPSMNNAMQKILGPDYQIAAPWCNRRDQGGMMGYHITGTDNAGHDQNFHKDGTDHGNTQSTVRDIRSRQVVMMYYPLGASLEQGPTAVVPQSQYYALDRGERPGSSEISLSAEGPMPKEFDVRDEWLQQSVNKLGGSVEDGFINYRVEVPPGAVVICHHQLFHRASRSEEGYFRPMVKLGAARISEPISNEETVSLPPNLPRSALMKAMWKYSQGQSNVDSSTIVTELTGFITTLHDDPSDVKRMEAAHTLAEAASGAGAVAALAMDALLDAFKLHLENEGASRNAMYGLCAVGDAVVSPVCAVLAEAAMPGQLDTTATGWKLACNATHILGQAASTHVSQELALGTIRPAMVTARTEIDNYLAHYDDTAAMDGHDYYAMERRRLLAEGSCAVGLIGHRAAVNDDSEIAIAALEVLLPVLCSDEPAEALPSFMWAGTVQNNAGCALLRLCSDTRAQNLCAPILPVFRVNNDQKDRMVAGTVHEALRRAEVLYVESPTQTRVALRERLVSVESQLRGNTPLFVPL